MEASSKRDAAKLEPEAAAARPADWQVRRKDGTAELCLSGDWLVAETGVRGVEAVRAVLADTHGTSVVRVVPSNLGRWNSALIAFVQDVRRAAVRQTEVRIDVSALPHAAQRLLALADAGAGEPSPPVARPHASLLAGIGRWVLRPRSELAATAVLVGETALRAPAALAGRTETRARDVLDLMREAGANALGIVSVVNVLVGAILAFVGSMQLRRFGAGIFAADLVGIATVREMAAVMSAVVMAGRTGGAYAAHLAAMQGNEEIDALKVLGIPIFDFLILPRIAALVSMMPLLYLYACAVGLLGGFVVSIATLDLSYTAFLRELRAAVSARQFALGFTKSVVFGALIALAGCRIGLRAGRSAADVGQAATSAVVAGIIGVIAVDAVFAICANALGI